MMDPARHSCACVILAAGASSRLGTPKQLLRFHGESLVHRAVRLAHQSGFAPICLVLGSNSTEMRSEVSDYDVAIVANDDWAQGMSTSLQKGIQYLLEKGSAGAKTPIRHLLVLVCDQLALSQQTLEHLLATSASRPDQIIASAYAGRLGVPAIFPAAFFEQLMQIQGDQGARVVIERLRDQVFALDFAGGDLDIDTAEDARRAGLL